jgi:hypothetical protein
MWIDPMNNRQSYKGYGRRWETPIFDRKSPVFDIHPNCCRNTNDLLGANQT